MILLLFSCHKKEKSFYEIKSINKDSLEYYIEYGDDEDADDE